MQDFIHYRFIHLKNIIMETKFIEQLVMAVPESLRETTLALQTEVEELLKAKSTKKFLVLEPYSRNT